MATIQAVIDPERTGLEVLAMLRFTVMTGRIRGDGWLARCAWVRIVGSTDSLLLARSQGGHLGFALTGPPPPQRPAVLDLGQPAAPALRYRSGLGASVRRALLEGPP
jgi:hypothetical protein